MFTLGEADLSNNSLSKSHLYADGNTLYFLEELTSAAALGIGSDNVHVHSISIISLPLCKLMLNK